MNNPAKQDDIICWHKETNNLISIVTETKLKGKIHPWIMNKFDDVWVFTSGLDSGYVGSGVVIVMDISLTRHMCKVSEVSGRLLSIKLLFKNKLSVSILGLYAGTSSMAGKVNFLIAKAVNEFSFVVLGGDFNENGLCRSASFKRCLDLGLVNSLLVDHNIVDVSKHFNTDYWAVSVSVGLGGLLDTQLNSFHRQANKNCWKFDFRSADNIKWKSFEYATLANADMFANKFEATVQLSNLDIMWNVLDSSRFHKLELLMSKLVKASHLVSSINVNSTAVVKSLFLSGSKFDTICLALAKIKKSYHSSKLLESRHAEKACIKAAINKRMESFESDKSHTIRSVLEHSFHKVVLDHLIVSNELVLEPSLVKSRVDKIMEDWTRKCRVMLDISDKWFCQYRHLKYVFDDAFSGVMCFVGINKLLGVKHCDKSVLDMLLVLLNSCLIYKSVPGAWKEAWVSIIPKLISLACSTFDVLRGDNFSVLRGMTMQSPIFAIGLVIEDALEKGCELWLVLQDMQKAYDSVGFFGGIHNDCVNRVMTDFGLTNGYRVHDGLDQKEVFLPLLWCIFYDSLLCKVKRQADRCGYRLNFYFISGCGYAKSWAGLFFFFTMSVFTVAIPINCKIADPSLLISGSPISIAKKEELHYYLGIYFLAKAHSDVWFFANLVLKKAVSDKQFLYLVLAVLFLIIGYRTQFSYVSVSACKKWDALIHKDLKSKSGVLCDFPSDTIHHFSLYDLKTFEQIQAENKLASVISFTNSIGILGHLFSHWSHDFQVLCWHPLHSLQYSVHVKINSLNNFLAGMVHIFFKSDLFLGGFLTNAFHYWSGTSIIMGLPSWTSCLTEVGLFLIGKPSSDGSGWIHMVQFLPDDGGFSNILCSCGFSAISANLLCSNVDCLSVYMYGSLSGLESVDIKAGAAVFFEDISMNLGVGVSGLMFSTLTELQTIALALECVSPSHSIDLFLDSQAALDACKLKLDLVCPDFKNQCWIECCYIVNIICHKNLNINLYKVKSHSGVSDNECTDELARAVALSSWNLPHSINEYYFRVGSAVISGNSRHFVWDVFWLVHCAYWKIGSGLQVVVDSLYVDINWFKSSLVWHPDFHMAAGFTNK
ncbi:hypothetical protein G9A89_018224 [Geosiphon pyriformis]|nr:hypothetical protein G9A89_018224 [Geosiphon pyriformis]